jgi:hypothetical protein
MDRDRRMRTLRAVAIAVVGTLALIAGSCGGDRSAMADPDTIDDPVLESSGD